MRGTGVLATVRTMTEIEALERARDPEAYRTAKTRPEMFCLHENSSARSGIFCDTSRKNQTARSFSRPLGQDVRHRPTAPSRLVAATRTRLQRQGNPNRGTRNRVMRTARALVVGASATSLRGRPGKRTWACRHVTLRWRGCCVESGRGWFTTPKSGRTTARPHERAPSVPITSWYTGQSHP